MSQQLFKVSSPTGRSLTIELQIEKLDPSFIRKRFLRNLGIGLGLTIASIFLPIVHFVLVPGFLIATFVVGYKTLSASEKIPSSAICCPQCGKEFQSQELIGAPPFKTICLNCSLVLKIERTAYLKFQ